MSIHKHHPKPFGLFSLLATCALVACAGADATDDDDGGGGAGNQTGTGATTSTGPQIGDNVCCLNGGYWDCADADAAQQACFGFDLDGCLAACAFDDFDCLDDCFAQVDGSLPDPQAAGCTRHPELDPQCAESPDPDPDPGPDPVGCQGFPTFVACDYDSDCATGNCFQGECYENGIGNPCDYDADCSTGNCYQNCCYGNGWGEPCDYDADCDSSVCTDNVCQ